MYVIHTLASDHYRSTSESVPVAARWVCTPLSQEPTAIGSQGDTVRTKVRDHYDGGHLVHKLQYLLLSQAPAHMSLSTPSRIDM